MGRIGTDCRGRRGDGGEGQTAVGGEDRRVGEETDR